MSRKVRRIRGTHVLKCGIQSDLGICRKNGGGGGSKAPKISYAKS